MTCVPRPTYEEMGEELTRDLTLAIEAFAARRGLTYDRRAYLSQCANREDALSELLGFGLDIWPAGVEDPEGEPSIVIPFESLQAARLEPRRLPAIAAALAMSLGLGSTLVTDAAEAREIPPAHANPLP